MRLYSLDARFVQAPNTCIGLSREAGLEEWLHLQTSSQTWGDAWVFWADGHPERGENLQQS